MLPLESKDSLRVVPPLPWRLMQWQELPICGIFDCSQKWLRFYVVNNRTIFHLLNLWVMSRLNQYPMQISGRVGVERGPGVFPLRRLLFLVALGSWDGC